MNNINPLIVDFAQNLGKTAIFDFARTGFAHGELLQTVKEQLGTNGTLDDFEERYVESLIELRQRGKHREILEFFLEHGILQAFYDYYNTPQNHTREQNQGILENSIGHYLSSTAIGDKLKAADISISKELELFHSLFRKEIQESLAVGGALPHQKHSALQGSIENLPREMEEKWNSIKGKGFFQRGEKIWNIGEIGQANFNTFIKGEYKFNHILTIPSLVPELFLGRDDVLQLIHSKLFVPGGNMLLLNGEGGLGKTSLAARYFDCYKAEYAHVAWVTSDQNLASAVLTLAGPLGLTEDETFLQRDIPLRIEALLTAMSNLPRPCLLIIDNANELEDLETYYPLLQRCSNFHILFTTRITEYGTAAFLEIPPLPEDLALQVFKTYYKAFEPTDEDHFRKLYWSVSGNTLVLEVFAKNLSQLNNPLKRRYPLKELVGDVEKGLLQLGMTEAVEVRYQHLQKASPEEIIRAMYNISKLAPEETAVLAAFAALPPEQIAFSDLEVLLEQENLDKVLLALATRGWLDYAEQGGAFRCSPVVQAAIRREYSNWRADCAKLVRGLAQCLEPEKIHEDNFLRSSLYARYAEAVVTLLDNLDYDLALLYSYLGNFHSDTGDLNKALHAFSQMAQIFEALLESNTENPDFKNGLAISYSKLGQTHADLGNLVQALSFFEEDLQLTKELYDAYPNNVSFKNGLAISYAKLGQTHADLGNLVQALSFFEQYTQLEKQLYDAYPNNVSFKNGLAISYAKLGQTHADLGNLVQALSFFEERSRLGKELYDAYPNNVSFKNGLAISYAKLAMVYLMLKRNEAAVKIIENYCQISQELYAGSSQNIVFCSNYAEALSIKMATQILSGKKSKESGFEEAIELFETLLENTGNEYYGRKIALCRKMQEPGVDLRSLIIEIISF